MPGLIRSLIRPVRRAWRRPAGVVLAVLAGCFLFASATGVRTDAAARDRALQTEVNQLPAAARTVVVGVDYGGFVTQYLGPGDLTGTAKQMAAESEQIGASFATQTQAAYSALTDGGSIPLGPESEAWSSLGTPIFSVGTYGTLPFAPFQGRPEIQFSYLEDYAQHARLVDGGWPQHLTKTPAGTFIVEIALSTDNMKLLGLHVGEKFLAQSDGRLPPPPLTIVISGAYQPIDSGNAYWQNQPSDISPQRVQVAHLPAYQLTGGLLGQGELAALALYNPFSPQSVMTETHIPLVTSTLTADQAGAMATELDSTTAQATASFQDLYFGTVEENFATTLSPTLAQFNLEQQAGRLETDMPTVSLALIGLIALMVAARAAVDRTTGQNDVLRARGAPLWRLAGTATRDAASTVVPLTAIAVISTLLIPGQSPPHLWEYELVLPLTAILWPGLLTALRNRRIGTGASARNPLPRRTELARRFVAQGALLVVCLLGLAEARSQGFSPNGGTNLFTASAPALAAFLAALITLNVGPVLLRLLLHNAIRRRGAIGLLGLARTARTPATAAATVLILTLTLATADLAVALHRAKDTTSESGPDALIQANTAYLALLAAMAIVAGCLVVALATAVEARERRAIVARLTTMGLTAGQARAVTAVELLGPIALAAIGGTLAVPPLIWTIRPALAPALGGVDARAGALTLALPLAAVAVLALLAGLAAAGAARRGVAGNLRLGDVTEG